MSARSTKPLRPSGRFGPGFLVTAAFIGPGTVTTASVAGARFGYALLWAVVFSVMATIILQEMTARLGVVTRGGLGEALRGSFTGYQRVGMILLVTLAIFVGNAAYQTGNIVGASMGLEILTGAPRQVLCGVIGAVAGILLFGGAYRLLERVLVALVLAMSLAFVGTAVCVGADIAGVLRGITLPRIPRGAGAAVIALIGTTVVPYNLFLHGRAVAEKWAGTDSRAIALRQARIDTLIAVTVGGVITLSIMLTAAACVSAGFSVNSAADMALQLEPLMGSYARWFFAAGLGAAGLTSAITAPLAAAYATAGVCGWQGGTRCWSFRCVWFAVLIVGTACAMFAGKSPVDAIVLAQIANGLLLPVVAVFLVVVVNRRSLLGAYTNHWWMNVAGAAVIAVAAILGIAGVLRSLG